MIKVDGPRFGRSWVTKKASRQVNGLLDELGEETVERLISTDAVIVSLVSPRVVAHYKERARAFRWAMSRLSGVPIEELLSPSWLAFMESCPGGIAWANREVKSVLKLLIGGGDAKDQAGQESEPHPGVGGEDCIGDTKAVTISPDP